MLFVYLLAGVIVPLLITPGLLFHFDTTPKVIVLAIAAVWALLRFRELPGEAAALWSRRSGRWFVIAAAVEVAWFGVTTATSTRPWFSLFGSVWRRFGLIENVSLMIVAIAIAGALAAQPAGVRVLLRMIVFAGLVASLYGIFQYFGLDPLQPLAAYQAHAGDSTIVRPPGTMGHADYFGWWLAVGFFCAIACAKTETAFWKYLANAAAVSICFAAVLSGTRAAIVAIVAGAVGMVLMNPSPVRLRPKHAMTVALAVVLFTAFVFSSAGSLLRARAVWSGDEPAGGARPLIWRDSLGMAAARPVFGFGPETYLSSFAHYQSEDLSRLFPDYHHESPHNLPLDALTSMGVPGLLLLAGWGAVAGFAVIRARREASPLAVPLGAALIASGTAAMFSAASMAPLLLSLLVVGILVSVSDSDSSRRTAPAMPVSLRLLAGMVAICLIGFGGVLAVADARAQRFAVRPDEASYVSLVDASLPGAAEDLYASRILQQVCGKRSDLVSFVTCRQQVMRAAGRALLTADDVANAWYSLSMLSASQNEIVWTRRGLEEAIKASPNWFKPHWALARLLSQTGETKQAAFEAARAAFLDSNRDPEVVQTATELSARGR